MRYHSIKVRHTDDLKRVKKITKIISNITNLLTEVVKISNVLDEASKEAGVIPKQAKVSTGFLGKLIRPFKTISAQIKAGGINQVKRSILYNLFRDIQVATTKGLAYYNKAYDLLGSMGSANEIKGVQNKLLKHMNIYTKLISKLDIEKEKLFIEMMAKSGEPISNINPIDVEFTVNTTKQYGAKKPTQNYSLAVRDKRIRHRDDLITEIGNLASNSKIAFQYIMNGEFKQAFFVIKAIQELTRIALNTWKTERLKSLASKDNFGHYSGFAKDTFKQIIDLKKTRERLINAFKACKMYSNGASDKIKSLLPELIKKITAMIKLISSKSQE